MSAESRQHYAVLDLARGLAALAVFGGHLRTFVFVDHEHAHATGVIWRVFYAITGFGHSAVMIFFVLSGFLIGSNVVQLVGNGRWTWREYAVQRLSRLCIVLIPALLLTFVFDRLGQSLTNSPFYSGALANIYHVGPTPDVAVESYSLKTFLLNLFFLQTIAAVPFGSNGPLWSLANEFWYYAIFPLLILLFDTRRNPTYRLVCAGCIVVLFSSLPFALLLAGVIWLFGFAAWKANTRLSKSKSRSKIVVATIAFFFFAAELFYFRVHPDLKYGDFAIGGVFAIFLIAASDLQIQNSNILKVTTTLSAMSYTLYLVHFPVLAYMAALLLPVERFEPGLAGIAVYTGLFICILGYAWVVYFFFEKRTPLLRRWLSQWFDTRAIRSGSA